MVRNGHASLEIVEEVHRGHIGAILNIQPHAQRAPTQPAHNPHAPDHRHGRLDALERRALAPVLGVVASNRVHVHLRSSLARQLQPLGADAPSLRSGPGRACLDVGLRVGVGVGVGFGSGAVGQLERIVDGGEVAVPWLHRLGVLPRQLVVR